MGIPGLLPLLKSIMLPIHIKDLKGCSVAVDTYSWLHKGALSCSKELCKGLPTSKHIDYCMHRVNMLRHYAVKPVLVFDGGLLPMKSEQENKRARSRRENLSRAMEHESNGNMTAAYESYQKAVDISPSVAYDLIQVLKQENISYVVAPYEADAQMTYLAISKQVDAVITEDSDLIAFGCPRIIYKMDKFGQGVEFHNSMLQQNKDLIFTGFTKQMFLEMCILSGCDYLQSLPGMGLKKAHALMKKFKSYDKVLKHLKYSSVAVSPLYEESFKKAILTFRHQRVYDPVTEEILHLFELSNSLDENLDFLGPSISQAVAKAIAKGDLDPFTKVPFEGERDGAELADNESYQLKNFKPEGGKKKLDLPAQKNLLTNYFCFASLEAKRKYKAPRATPNHRNPENGLNTTSYAYSKTNSHRKMNSTLVVTESVNCSATAEAIELLESRTNGIDEMEASREDRETRQDILQHSIYKPCTILHKERTSDPSQSEMRSEGVNVIVRSSYFLHKATKEANEVQTKNSVAADPEIVSASYAKEPASVDCERKMNTINKNVVVRSSYFQDKTVREKIQYDKGENHLVGELAGPHNNLFGLDKFTKSTADEDTARGRSYYQESSLNKCENFTVKDGITTDIGKYKYDIPRISSSNNYLEEARKRRKVVSIDNPEPEDFRRNGLLTGGGLPMPSLQDYTSQLGDTAHEIKAQEDKFGCNISHLGHYSEIAEKSLEKFVSVISSFKFTSSGSRASGLRAPLKDVKNTCSKSNMDLSKFAYVPTKKASSNFP